MYEMEKILATVMTNKGLYPKYIKRGVSKATKHAMNLTEKWG